MESAMLTVTRQFEAALGIVERLRAAGYEAYLAGGCVRDLLLGRAPHDYDVATSATPDVVLGLFPRTFAVGAHFGVVLVASEMEDEAGGCEGSRGAERVTEVATLRSDGAYSDGRHPDAVKYTKSAEEDVRRRDFTIHGLLLDAARLFPQGINGWVETHPYQPAFFAGLDVRAEARTLQSVESASPIQEDLRAAVIDYVGGVADLEAGVVRAIGRAELRFEEDHLRMLL